MITADIEPETVTAAQANAYRALIAELTKLDKNNMSLSPLQRQQANSIREFLRGVDGYHFGS